MMDLTFADLVVYNMAWTQDTRLTIQIAERPDMNFELVKMSTAIEKYLDYKVVGFYGAHVVLKEDKQND